MGAPPGHGKPAAAAPPGLEAKAVKEILHQLNSADASVVLEGLAAAKAAGPAGVRVASAIEGILSRGSTAPITRASIETLGAIGARSSSAAIRPYLRHRVAEIRRDAAEALVSTGGSEAVAAFKDGLRGADGEVRIRSAKGLGSLGAREALPELFLALEHDVTEAAAAIGQVCVGDECDMLIARLGKEPLPVMTSGLDALLFRKRPLSEAEQNRIIDRVRALGTPDAGKYLSGLVGRWPLPSIPGSGK